MSLENSLKQRIIGAVVLVALAIIFLPAILKEKASNGTFQSKIPTKPVELERYQIDTEKVDRLIAEDFDENSDNKFTPTKPVLDKDLANTPVNDENDNSRKSKKDNKQPPTSSKVATQDKPFASDKKAAYKSKKDIEKAKNAASDIDKIDENFKTSAWVVQVASFSNKSNAVNLVEKLKKNKFKAYRRKVKSSGQWVFRVFVGPYIEKPQASKSLISINKVSETQSIVRPFNPVKH